MTRLITKSWAFLVRDFRSDVSYRFAFVLQFAGMFFAVATFFYVSRMVDPATAALDGVPPFPWFLVGIGFQLYFSTALNSFAEKVRTEQVSGTLEAMLVSPTPTLVVIFASTAWDFAWSGARLLVYLLCAVLVFGVKLNVTSPVALAAGIGLTLVSSAGIGMISASFILYFKRADPINFLLLMSTTFFGNVFIPSRLLPHPIQWVSDWFPMSWSLQVVRGTLLRGDSFHDVAGPIERLAILTAVLVPAGLMGAHIAIRKAKREGSLVQY